MDGTTTLPWTKSQRCRHENSTFAYAKIIGHQARRSIRLAAPRGGAIAAAPREKGSIRLNAM